MRASFKPLLVLLAPVLTLGLRLPFVLSREAPYGMDPYIHLYYIKAWLRTSAWPLLTDPEGIIPYDYNAWPGAHVLAASVSSLDLEPLRVLEWAPLVILFALNLAIVLIVLRRTNLAIAVATGILLGLADYVFVQTQWYVPELIGLLFVSGILLNELNVGSRVLSLLFLTALLVTHHLSFLMGAMVWALVTPGPLDRRYFASMAIIVVEVLVFWEFALRNTGSFPDIKGHLGGVPPAFLAALIVVLLAALRWGLTRLYVRYTEGQGEGTLLDLVSSRSPLGGRSTVIAGLVALVVVTAIVYLSSITRWDGIGFQPTKLLVLSGGVLFLAFVPTELWNLRVLAAFGLVFLLFVLNPVVFDFITLEVRFLEFLYLLGFVLLASGVFWLCIRRPEWVRAVVLALVLVSAVLLIDNSVRYASDESQRFVFTQEDIDFAEAVAIHTESDAIIVPPFSLSSVVRGVSERLTRTHPVGIALDEGGYGAAEASLSELREHGPVYLVHSVNHLFYMETVDQPVSPEELGELALSLPDISDRLELVLGQGGHVLYRFD